MAGLWEIYYRQTDQFFQNELAADIIGGFRQLQTDTQAEILTSAATHAHLPLLGISPLGTPLVGSVPASLGGQPVQRQGIDHILATAGLQYCMVDQPQLIASLPSSARPSPLRLHHITMEYPVSSAEPVTIFTRDFETTARVWQHEEGYPGDPWYLEFHKKHAEGALRYWRITDRQADLSAKQLYVPEAAFGTVSMHAAQFAVLLRERLHSHREQTEEKGIVVAAFDTELFGHWWFEGPQWLTELIRQVSAYDDISLTTCGAFLHNNPPQRPVQLVESSWGEGGDHRV